MFDLLSLASSFLSFWRDRLVPFFTQPMPELEIPWLSWTGQDPDPFQIEYLIISWPFGGSIASFILFVGIIATFSYRVIKFFVP